MPQPAVNIPDGRVDQAKRIEIDLGDTRQLRDAFGRFATGIVIVTCDFRGERIGTTVSSFNSVSLVPPLVSFCIARTARAMTAWEETPGFAVSVLSRSQADLSTRFARSLGDKWSDVATRPASCVDARLIDDALMWFECETYARYDGGDHVIVVGRVVAARSGSRADPLLFYGGAYRHLAPPSEHESLTSDDMWLHAW